MVPAIQGNDSLYPFDTAIYTIENAENGVWFVSNNKAAIKHQTMSEAEVTIVSGKSGSFDLISWVSSFNLILDLYNFSKSSDIIWSYHLII